MLFRYKAIKNDKVVIKNIEAESEQAVVNFLKSNDYMPIEVKKAENLLRMLSEGANPLLTRVSVDDIVNFTRQLAIMLNAGLTITDALKIFEKQTDKKGLRKIISVIDEQIRAGNSLSGALKMFPRHFSTLYISLIRAGEASGKLSEILLRLAENLEKDREMKRRLKSSLIYPLIIFVSMIIVIFTILTFVVPKLLALYKEFEVELPLTTQILIAISTFSATFWPFIILGVVAVVFLGARYLKTRRGRYLKDSVLLRLPVIGNVFRSASLVDNTRTLALMVGAGVPILDSLNIIIETTDNVIFQDAFSNALKNVEKGSSLGSALSSERVFPVILVQMTIVGENTGHLDDTLTRLSRYFEIETEIAIKTMTTLIEPTILIFLGVSVGFLVLSVITPIYNLTGSFK
jgi:type II secretory pathway component PulF